MYLSAGLVSAMATTDDLQELPGVGPATEEKLRENGYESFSEIAVASPSELVNKANLGEGTAADTVKISREKADVGGFETGETVYERRQEIGTITTGVDELDSILHGSGVQSQSITEVYGEFGSGKSQIAHQLAVNVQLPVEHGGMNQQAYFIDTEDTFRPARIRDMVEGLSDERKLGLMDKFDIVPSGEEALETLKEHVLRNINVAKAFNSNHQIILTETALENAKESDENIGLLIVDSLTAHFRAEYVGRGELAERQQTLNKHLSDINRFADSQNAVVFVTNQVSADPDSFFGDPTQPIGGNILGHTSTVRLYMKKSKDTKRVIKVVDAPDLPNAEAVVSIESDGLTDS